jgi:hypothetical protein
VTSTHRPDSTRLAVRVLIPRRLVLPADGVFHDRPGDGTERPRTARRVGFDARNRAYAELFEGANAAPTDGELRLLDRIDSDPTRRDGSGTAER